MRSGAALRSRSRPRRATTREAASVLGRLPSATARGWRRRWRRESAPVVEHEVRGVLVVLLLAPLHPDHREVDLISALDEDVVRGPVASIHGEDHPLHAQLLTEPLDDRDELLEVLRLPLRRIDREELHVQGAGRSLADAVRVADREADDVAAALEQERVAERQAVDDLDLLREVHAA